MSGKQYLTSCFSEFVRDWTSDNRSKGIIYWKLLTFLFYFIQKVVEENSIIWCSKVCQLNSMGKFGKLSFHRYLISCWCQSMSIPLSTSTSMTKTLIILINTQVIWVLSINHIERQMKQRTHSHTHTHTIMSKWTEQYPRQITLLFLSSSQT